MIVARTAFAANWLLMRRLVAGALGKSAAGREPPAIGQPRFLSLIARLPLEVAEGLAEAASGFGQTQPEHYLYPPADIHLTVLGLADLPGLEGQVGVAVARHRPFEVEVWGLNVSSDTVFAELHPRGPGLRALRGDLRSAESGEHGSISRWLRRRLAHANVMRFGAPVDPRLLAEVGRLRAMRFGRFEVDEVELVRTDKVLSRAGTRTLGQFRLG